MVCSLYKDGQPDLLSYSPPDYISELDLISTNNTFFLVEDLELQTV